MGTKSQSRFCLHETKIQPNLHELLIWQADKYNMCSTKGNGAGGLESFGPFAVYDAWKERNIKIMSYGLIATLIVVAIVVGAITTKNVRLSRLQDLWWELLFSGNRISCQNG